MLELSKSEQAAFQKTKALLQQLVSATPEWSELGKNGRWQLDQLVDARLKLNNLTP